MTKIDPTTCQHVNIREINGCKQCLDCKMVFYPYDPPIFGAITEPLHAALKLRLDEDQTSTYSFTIRVGDSMSTSPRRFSTATEAVQAISQRMLIHAMDEEYPMFALVQFGAKK